MYISTCIHNKILSPTLWFENLILSWGVDLWFSKSRFQHDFFKIVLKVRLFKNTDGHRPFFENLMKIWKFQKFDSPLGKGRRSRPNQYLRSVDQAHTISLRGPKWDLHSERRRRQFDGMDGWMDGTEYQKCPSNFFILCGYIGIV